MRFRISPFSIAALACPLGAIIVERLLEARDEARLNVGERFVTRGRARVRYRTAGESLPAPTVVLLNGFVAPLEQWDDVRAAVGTFAPVLAYDRGGLGLSRRSEAHDATSQAAELLDVLTATKARLPVVLVGYSASALLARAFTAKHPELVRGLVIIDGDTPEQILEPAYRGRNAPGRPWVPMDPWAYVSGRTAIANALGLVRLDSRNEPAPKVESESSRRLRRLYLLTPHWWAAYREGRARKVSGRAALAWPGKKTDLPLGVLTSGAESADPYQRDLFELNRGLAACSSQSSFVSVAGGHNRMIEDGPLMQVVVETIRAVVEKASSGCAPKMG